MLELQNICLTAEDDGKEILKDVSLKIEKGSFTAITGPNGGGKSSLAKIIAGVMTPDSGRILLNGKDITDLDVTARARAGISFAFQQPVRFKGLHVIDLLSLAAGEELSMPKACEYLAAVGLQGRSYATREVDGSLSGGEMKRIEIAMSIARGADFSIFDEPEAGIDLWSFQNLIEVFGDMQKVAGRTVVVISHQERILEIADSIVVLNAGQLVTAGSKEDILPILLSAPSAPCSNCGGACPQGTCFTQGVKA